MEEGSIAWSRRLSPLPAGFVAAWVAGALPLEMAASRSAWPIPVLAWSGDRWRQRSYESGAAELEELEELGAVAGGVAGVSGAGLAALASMPSMVSSGLGLVGGVVVPEPFGIPLVAWGRNRGRGFGLDRPDDVQVIEARLSAHVARQGQGIQDPEVRSDDVVGPRPGDRVQSKDREDPAAAFRSKVTLTWDPGLPLPGGNSTWLGDAFLPDLFVCLDGRQPADVDRPEVKDVNGAGLADLLFLEPFAAGFLEIIDRDADQVAGPEGEFLVFHDDVGRRGIGGGFPLVGGTSMTSS